VRPRHQVEPLLATRLEGEGRFVLANGMNSLGHPGDWAITRGPVTLAVLPPAVYEQEYAAVDEHSLTLTGAERAEVARALGFGSTETSSHLVTAAKRLAHLTIGTIDVDFTPGQWEELAHRATKRGLSVESLVKQIVDKITQDIWQS
jgi:hypothetical protein